jgi:hypothetical protein
MSQTRVVFKMAFIRSGETCLKYKDYTQIITGKHVLHNPIKLPMATAEVF